MRYESASGLRFAYGQNAMIVSSLLHPVEEVALEYKVSQYGWSLGENAASLPRGVNRGGRNMFTREHGHESEQAAAKIESEGFWNTLFDEEIAA